MPQKGGEALGGKHKPCINWGRGVCAAEQHKHRKGREEGCSTFEERRAWCMCRNKTVKGDTAYACLQTKEGRKV